MTNRRDTPHSVHRQIYAVRACDTTRGVQLVEAAPHIRMEHGPSPTVILGFV